MRHMHVLLNTCTMRCMKPRHRKCAAKQAHPLLCMTCLDNEQLLHARSTGSYNSALNSTASPKECCTCMNLLTSKYRLFLPASTAPLPITSTAGHQSCHVTVMAGAGLHSDPMEGPRADDGIFGTSQGHARETGWTACMTTVQHLCLAYVNTTV